MITNEELLGFAERFGVPEPQIARDHLISHLLLALPHAFDGGDWVFFGGTALCRTHLLDWRLSEDIDLLVDEPRRWEDALATGLPQRVRRNYPELTITWSQDGRTRVGRAFASGLAVKLQLVPLDHSYRRYPTTPQRVHLRYSDLPSTLELRVPDLVGATAMKVNAWIGRQAPRDLADLYALAQRGHVTSDAVDLAHSVSSAVVPQLFDVKLMPSEDEWRTALAAQMRRVPDVREAFDVVRSAVAAAAAW